MQNEKSFKGKVRINQKKNGNYYTVQIPRNIGKGMLLRKGEELDIKVKRNSRY